MVFVAVKNGAGGACSQNEGFWKGRANVASFHLDTTIKGQCTNLTVAIIWESGY
jgi:hypothetical protein